MSSSGASLTHSLGRRLAPEFGFGHGGGSAFHPPWNLGGVSSHGSSGSADVSINLDRVSRRIREVAQHECQNMTLGELMRRTKDGDNLVSHGRWLQRQLPIRFARRIEDFLHQPYVVISNPNIQRVLSTHVDTFKAMSDFPEIQTPDDEANFCALVVNELEKHGQGALLVAVGYQEVRQAYPHIHLHEFLNNFFTARIASRLLMDHYVAMRDPQPNFVGGVVRQGMRPQKLVEQLSDSLIQLTRSIYGCAPTLEYRGNLDCLLDYIPRHVQYMVRELLKNALRATVEHHQAKSMAAGHARPTLTLPPVVVEFQKGDVHVLIKISDSGGGIPKQLRQETWRYGWTTVRNGSNQDRVRSAKKDLAGYGFGLPLTRLHAQYFGGDVFMQTLIGHGTDMYLLLTHLKEGTPSTEAEDLSSILHSRENSGIVGESPKDR